MGGEACGQHTGIVAEIKNTKDWQKHHEEVVHVTVDKKLEDLSKRLPNWATFIISGMGTVIGYLLALVRLQ